MTSGSGDPHVLQPGHAPTPFTAAGIRQGCTRGRTVRLLVEPVGGEPFVRVIRFVECDEDGATQETLRLSVDGEAPGRPTPHRTSWVALQAHASYPDEQTDVAAETVQTPLGPLECLRYTVARGSSVDTFWFARTLPGMPVRPISRVDGRTTGTVTMIGNEVDR
jgi:hypothetical protein